MKRRDLLLLLLLVSTLVVGGTLISCTASRSSSGSSGEEPTTTVENPDGDTTVEEDTYNITVNADAGVSAYRFMNLTIGGTQSITSASAGDEIMLTGIGTYTNYYLVSVTSTQVTLVQETAGYSFTMPNEDVVINITTVYVRSPEYYFTIYSSSYTYVDIVAYSGEVFENSNINPADYDVTSLLGGTNFYSGEYLGITLTIKEEYVDTYSTISFSINDVTHKPEEYTFTYTEDSVQKETKLNLYKIFFSSTVFGSDTELYGTVRPSA